MRKFLFVAALFLSSCAGAGNYHAYLEGKRLPPATLESFPHCHGYGCVVVDNVTLSKTDWKAIEKTFTPKPKSAEEERARIARAIGVFETRVGAITGTGEDERGTFRKTGRNQHDCVDESTNTTIYLALLQQKGLLRFHDVGAPTSRVPVIHYMGRWPHQTAVISEKTGGASFAVDSWFHDNGEDAEIAPLDVWKSGWKPESSHDSFL
jgi:hypothetical protein